MNYIIKNPADMGIYVQTRNVKTIGKVAGEIGADVICNFQMFTIATREANFVLKADGEVIGWDGANYWGYGWNKGDKTFTLDRAENMGKYENFAGCVPVVLNGKSVNLQSGVDYPAAIGGRRGRTCIGLKADGSIVLYCWPDGSAGACRMEELGQKMIALGCVNAINFDGGGSTQMICPNGKVTTPRAIYNFLWFKEKEQPTVDEMVCPYSEPRSNVRYGSRGTGAKWVQWHLNKHGAKLVVDGIFGLQSRAELKMFQCLHGLEADGICGKLTIAKLKE